MEQQFKEIMKKLSIMENNLDQIKLSINNLDTRIIKLEIGTFKTNENLENAEYEIKDIIKRLDIIEESNKEQLNDMSEFSKQEQEQDDEDDEEQDDVKSDTESESDNCYVFDEKYGLVTVKEAKKRKQQEKDEYSDWYGLHYR